MWIARSFKLKGFTAVLTLFCGVAANAAQPQKTFACFVTDKNSDFVTFLEEQPDQRKCDAVRGLQGLYYASSKGPNVGFTSRLDTSSKRHVLDRPDAYSFGGNRLAIFEPLSGGDNSRLDTLSLDAMTMLSMPEFDRKKNPFYLSPNIRSESGARNPHIAVDFGPRDYKRVGRRTVEGSVGRDMCGDLIEIIERPKCQVVGNSNSCMKLRDLGFHKRTKPNVSTVDAALMRPLREFSLDYDTKYALSREIVTGQVLRLCSKIDTAAATSTVQQNLVAAGYSKKQKSISKLVLSDIQEIASRFSKANTTTFFSSYKVANPTKGSHSRTTTLHIYEYARCSKRDYESVFQVIDVENELFVAIVVSQPMRKNLVANPASYANFLSQFLDAGFNETIAQAAIIRLSAMKKI